MELIQLLSFYHIVKTGSFSKAAINVFRSQSAISHQIKNLENEFKIKLFERLGKKVKLTEEGEILFDVISPFVNDLENLKRIYEDIQHAQYGNLTVAIAPSIMRCFFLNIIKMFTGQFPGIKLKLITCGVTSMQPMVLNDEVDFGIGRKTPQLFSKNLNFLSWKSFARGLLVAKDHPLGKKKTVTLEDIAKYPFIQIRTAETTKKVKEILARNKISYEIMMEMDFAEDIKKFVEMGIGVSIISTATITKEDSRKLVFFNLAKLFGKIEYGIYYREGKYFTNKMKQFITCFAPELLDQLPTYTLRRA